MTLREKIEQALKGVIDPGTNLDVMRMKLVRDLTIDEEGRVHLTFRPPSPVCPMAFSLAHNIQRAVERTEGVTGVEVKVAGYNRAEELTKILDEAAVGGGAFSRGGP